MITRRSLLAAPLALPAFAASERYRLGVMATMYASLPLDEAMPRIRNLGYRYISLARRHANDAVLDPALSSTDRKAVLRRIRNHGIEPFLTLGGFGGSDLQTPDGLRSHIAQLDLCTDYEIPIMVGAGPWYYTKFPTMPKRELDWQQEVSRFYAGLEKALRHAESIKVAIALKPHTGITARGRDCLEVLKRFHSPYFKIAWDAGNISYYEGIYPDPDLPDVAPNVNCVCLKDHLGLRGVNDFPPPGQGQVDHEQMFRTLLAAGFNGPLAIERVDGKDGGMNKVPPATIDQRLKAAHDFLVPLLDKVTAKG
jgi:sugar phosphate isomerase/epimerase